MIRELDLFGVFLPPLVLMIGVAVPAWLVLRALLTSSGLARRVWHPALFNLSGFVLLLSLVVLAVFR